MKRPETIDGMPLMASTKILTVRRSRERLSFRKMAHETPSGKRDEQGQADLLEGPDDGVQPAAGGGRLGRR